MNEKLTPEYEFEVVEPMVTENIYAVIARTRAEALEKVLEGDRRETGVYAYKGSVRPTRPMTVRDVKRVRRVTELNKE